MKRQILMAAAVAFALQAGAAGRAVAMDNGNDKAEGRRHGGPGARSEEVAGRLKLNDDQKKTFDAVVKERREKMSALQDEFMAKRKAISDATDAKITAVLNADQKVEFAKMKEEFEKRRDEFKSHRREGNDDRPEHSDPK